MNQYQHETSDNYLLYYKFCCKTSPKPQSEFIQNTFGQVTLNVVAFTASGLKMLEYARFRNVRYRILSACSHARRGRSRRMQTHKVVQRKASFRRL